MIRALVHLVSQLFPCLPWMSVSDSSSAAALRGLSSKPPSVPMLIEGCGVETSEEPPDLIVFEAEIDSWLDDIKTPVLEPERPATSSVRFEAPSSKASTAPSVTTPSVTEASTSLSSATTRSAKTVEIPWDGKIRWALGTSGVFDSPDEEQGVASIRSNFISQRKTASELWVFQYGLRYIPGPAQGNSFRTVKIEDLPLSTTMDQVLEAIRGGDVFSAQLLNTGFLTGYHTAIVVFLYQNQAVDFADRARRSGFFIRGKRAKVSVLNTPTYPMSAEMERLIFEEGSTRCVALYNFDRSLVENLYAVLRGSVCWDYLECIEHGYEQNAICIRFHCIKIAAVAYELLRAHAAFRRCKVEFVNDPCARPAEAEPLLA